MALIRATCSECGDVELRSRDLQVRICGDTGDGTYLFRCPVCRMTEVKNADDQVVDILAAAGVKCVEWRLPAEMTERPTGEPITHDASKSAWCRWTSASRRNRAITLPRRSGCVRASACPSCWAATTGSPRCRR